LHPLAQRSAPSLAFNSALEDACARPTQPQEERRAAVQRQADIRSRSLHKTGHVSFREEEELLLTAYAWPTARLHDPAIMRLLADHAEIRKPLCSFRAPAREETPIAAAAMCPPLQTSPLLRALKRHVFPADLKRVLGEENLDAMGRGLTRLVPKRRLRPFGNWA